MIPLDNPPSKEPKDYRLGRRAYEAFYREAPQTRFSNLAHSYQMMWVAVARSVEEELKRMRPAITPAQQSWRSKPRRKKDEQMTLEEAKTILSGLPRNNRGHIRWSELRGEKKKQAAYAINREAYLERRK